MRKWLFALVIVGCWACSQRSKDVPAPDPLQVRSLLFDGLPAESAPLHSLSVEPQIAIDFTLPVDPASAFQNIVLLNSKGERLTLHFAFQDDQRSIVIHPSSALEPLERFSLVVTKGLKGAGGSTMEREYSHLFYTHSDGRDRMDRITDDALLDLVQRQTLRYFVEFSHPESGMARERNSSLNTVTTGGSGFGAMALCVGVERGWIAKDQALDQLRRILTFLERVPRYKGAFSHWYEGNTGRTLPFSTLDNGADLVETSLLLMGLMTAAAYLDDPELQARTNALYQEVEWDFFLNNSDCLFWHWSPDHGFALNLKIQGWNEALITYILAAGSDKFAISKEHYEQGWARNGSIVNGNTYHGLRLPLGPDYGGPLFLSQYSFLGINPTGLSDLFLDDYAVQCRNHTLINRAYCMNNPQKMPGYGQGAWGLTASDNAKGYRAHSPKNDQGVIAPTAALASFPYAPQEAMEALHFFYYRLGHKLWGAYGFKDAFSVKDNWYADSYVAINQGPIIIGIENYRSGLIWENGIKNPSVKKGLETLGFRYSN